MNHPQLWRTSGFTFALLLAPLAAPSLQAAGHTVRGGETFTSIAKKYKVSVTTLQKANTKVKPGLIAKGQSLNVPANALKGASLIAKPAKAAPAKAKAPGVVESAKLVSSSKKTAAVAVAKPVKKTSANAITTYRVRPGDTATSLARRSGISVGELADMNGLDRLELREGQKLVIPSRTPVPAALPQERENTVDLTPPARRSKTEEPPARRPAPAMNPPTTQGTYYHVVKRGETFSSIARDQRVSVTALTKANRSVNPARLAVGQSLNIPGVQVASRQPLEELIDETPAIRNSAYRFDGGEDEISAPEGTIPSIAYRITTHDSAETLAREFHSTPADLRHMNQMGPFDQFKPGDFIRVPWHNPSRVD